MNRELLEDLRQTLIWLRDVPQAEFVAAGDGAKFDFQFFHLTGGRCGTKMCLAGWYVHRHPDCKLAFGSNGTGDIVHLDDTEEIWDDFDALAEYFGIQLWLSNALFQPPVYDEEDDYIEYDYQDRKFWAGRAVAQLDLVLATVGDDIDADLESRLVEMWSDRYPLED